MKKKRFLAAAALVLAGLVSVSSGTGIVTGFHNYSGYSEYNRIHQWQLGSSASDPETKYLGSVKLDDAAHFNYDIKLGNGDLATLANRDIVIAHRDSADTKWQVSVLRPRYDGGGSLTNMTILMTMDQPAAYRRRWSPRFRTAGSSRRPQGKAASTRERGMQPGPRPRGIFPKRLTCLKLPG